MTHNEAHDRYVLYLLGELSESDTKMLETQLETDASVRESLESTRILMGYFDEILADPVGSKELAERIVVCLEKNVPARSSTIWWWSVPLALAASLILAVSFVWWMPNEPPQGSTRNISALAEGWRIEPTGDADYTVVDGHRIRLERGELYVYATETPNDTDKLIVETPDGEAVAHGTQFYIGSHSPSPKGERIMKRFTRVLVLTGVVTLTNALGSITGGPNELLSAEPQRPPVKLTVRANTDFAVDLYKQLAQENEGENLFFSPYSVSNALMMTLEGARGETAVQMGEVLGLPKEMMRVGGDAQLIPWRTSMIHSGMADLNDSLMGDKDKAEVARIRTRIAELRAKLEGTKKKLAQLEAQRDFRAYSIAHDEQKKLVAELNAEMDKVDRYEIRVANALWAEKTYPFRKEYFDTVNKFYKTGGVFNLSFLTAAEEARLRINGWVEEQTNKRIKDLIPRGAVDDSTRLVLTNAIYFKGDWADPFDKARTKDRGFTLGDGTKVVAPIMTAEFENVRYAAFQADGSYFKTPTRRSRFGESKTPKLYPGTDGFAMVEIPYKGDALSMVVIAPNDPKGLHRVEAKMTAENLAMWLSQLKKRDTLVHLPKFKLETEYQLGDSSEPTTLQTLGMVRAFNDPRDPKHGAQFQGMTTSTNPARQLYISKVLHKAFVEVNEEGTEAAAATAVVVVEPTSIPASVPFVPEFKADRPFVFAIRDNKSGSILFLGRMSNPTS